VVCFSPEDGTRLVKRIIGLPGDTVELKNNRLFLNGRGVSYGFIAPRYTRSVSAGQKEISILAEEDLDGAAHAVMSTPSIPAMRDFGPVTVQEGSYFVLGDNRDKSRDSRFFGFIERKAIVGRARGVIVSFDITDKYQPRFKRFFDSLD
jgi:signal peptidase I